MLRCKLNERPIPNHFHPSSSVVDRHPIMMVNDTAKMSALRAAGSSPAWDDSYFGVQLTVKQVPL